MSQSHAYNGNQYVGSMVARVLMCPSPHANRQLLAVASGAIPHLAAAQSNSLTVAAPYTAVYWYNRARRDAQYHALLRTARAHGEASGEAAGSWVIDGNTPDMRCADLRRMIDDGDPVFFDTIPNPLSGEWADDPRPADIVADVMDDAGMPEDMYPSDLTDEEWNEVLDEWQAGFVDGYTGQVYRDATSRLDG